ncbi:MAG: winged helix-turn-helix transcriptional regulator [Clostridiales bacterium]|nr:winged helix-turn-helix transcriptional regulator [Clostridiales bacterium]
MIEIFKSLSEESRLRIISLLMQKEMCVCEIETCLKMTQSNASRHLTDLKRSGILESYKKAQWTYYKISPNFIENNKELWEYLKKEIRNMRFYAKDLEEYKKCAGSCIVNKKPH